MKDCKWLTLSTIMFNIALRGFAYLFIHLPRVVAKKKTQMLVSVQILRAIAAGCVVADHVILRIISDVKPYTISHVAWLTGSIGVGVFFAISGLLMVETTYDRFGKNGTFKDFLKKRIARILPMYWIFTAVIVLVTILGGNHVDLVAVLKSLFFFPYPTGNDMRPVLSVGWTLNYEMFFYLIFSFSLLFQRKLGLTVLFLIFSLVVALGTSQKSVLDTSDPSTALEFWSAPIILLFPAGCIIALVRRKIISRLGALPYCPAPPFTALLIILMTVTLVAMTGTEDIYPLTFLRQLLLWAGALMAVAVCALTKNPPSQKMTPLLILLGNASYSTYLSHNISISFLNKAIAPFIVFDPWILFAWLFIMSNVIGILIHKFVELPVLTLFRPRKNALRDLSAQSQRPPRS